MWMMLGWAFLAESPRLYMTIPHATAQYGQVLRVSVARESLNSRTSARATDGENPIKARLEPAREAPVTARNRRRVISTMGIPFGYLCLQRSVAPAIQGSQGNLGVAGGLFRTFLL